MNLNTPTIAPGQLTEDDFPTVRTFPRTMHGIEAAFPHDPEYASAMQRFEGALDWFNDRAPLWFILSACIGAVAGVAAIVWGGA